MDEHLAHHLAWHRLYYRALRGATITSASAELGEDEDGLTDECWPTLTATLANGDKVTLEVSQDEEGNGPGFLFGLPMPTQEETKVRAKFLLVDIKAGKERAKA